MLEKPRGFLITINSNYKNQSSESRESGNIETKKPEAVPLASVEDTHMLEYHGKPWDPLSMCASVSVSVLENMRWPNSDLP